MNYNEKKGQLYLLIGALVSVIVACSALYTIYLINRSGMADDDNGESDIDIYQIELERHLGVGGSDYNNRPIYTSGIFDSDVRTITQALENKRFDQITDMAGMILAKYQFNDDKLSTISALEVAYVFDPDYSATTNERIHMVSKIKDPILYLRFFLLLSIEEQRILVQYPNVNILPSFQYYTITFEKTDVYPKGFSSIIPSENVLYKLTLNYTGHEYYVYMSVGDCCNIISVNDEFESLNTTY